MQTTTKDLHSYLLSLLIVVGFFILTYTLFFVELSAGSRDTALVLLGVFGSGFGAVINYFFGSSEGSKEKTKMMTKGK
jgi:hypothetical protein